MNDLRLLGRLLAGNPPGVEVNWGRVIALAQRHGVSPLLFWELARRQGSGVLSIPEEPYEALRRDFYAAAARAMVAERQLAQVLQALAEAGVPTLVVKGAAVGAYYPDPALRSYGDLDVVVPRHQLEQATAALARLGYQGSGQKQWRLAHHFHLPPLHHETGRLTVEVHWQLDRPEQPWRLPVEELWARAVPWAVAGQPTLRLEGVDTVLYLSLHTLSHHLARLGLRPLCDLAQVIEGWGPSEWEALVRRAVDYRLTRAVYLMLRLAEEVLQAMAPVQVREALSPHPEDPAVGNWIAAFLDPDLRSVPPMPVTAVLAWAHEAGLGRFCYLWRRLYPPREEMAAIYDIPPDSPRIWLAYLLRPADLFRRYRSALLNLAQRNPTAQAAWGQETWLEGWLKGET
ncbi:MAG: nucleotidyltransferase domain-containing protein [Anaerolineae bacterium]